jgi:hypothetical protein
MVVAAIFGFGFYLWYRRRKAKRRFKPVDLIGSPLVTPAYPCTPSHAQEGSWKPQIEDTAVRPYIVDMPAGPVEDASSDGHGAQMVEARSPRSPEYIYAVQSVAALPHLNSYGQPAASGSSAISPSATTNRNFLPGRALDAGTVMSGSLATGDAKRIYGSSGSLITAESAEGSAPLMRSTSVCAYWAREYGGADSCTQGTQDVPAVRRPQRTGIPEPRSPTASRLQLTTPAFLITNPDRTPDRTPNRSPIEPVPTVLTPRRRGTSLNRRPSLPRNPRDRPSEQSDSRLPPPVPPPILTDRRPEALDCEPADDDPQVSPQETLPPNYYEATRR